jgi:hypothetical protein
MFNLITFVITIKRELGIRAKLFLHSMQDENYFLFFYSINTGFLSRLPLPSLISSRLKGKCSEYERYSQNYAANAALQVMTKENTRNENGKSKSFLCEANPSLVMRGR